MLDLASFFTSPPVAVGLLVLALLLSVGYAAHPVRGAAYFLSVLIVTCAVGLGVLAGSFASPSETSEGAMFKVVAGVLATFATGFLAKQFESQVQGLPTWLAKNGGLNAARFWMFVSAFVAASIITYVYRAYFAQAKPEAAILKEVTEDLSKVQAKLDKLAHAIGAASAARQASAPASAP